MSTTNLPTGLTLAAAEKELDATTTNALASADSTSAVTVKNLGLVQQAKLSQLSRTAATAVAQFGSTSKQATAAKAAVTASQTTVSRVAMVNQQLTTPAPAVAAKGWALHGRVYDATLAPLAGHSVFLVDDQKNYQSAYGFDYTDSTGYFLINYPGPAAATGEEATKATKTAEATKADTSSAESAELYLQITNTSALPVYLSTTAFTPSVGAATYQAVTLPAGEPAIGDPPSQVRAVALPPAQQNPPS
jgi:hypothetical protein